MFLSILENFQYYNSFGMHKKHAPHVEHVETPENKESISFSQKLENDQKTSTEIPLQNSNIEISNTELITENKEKESNEDNESEKSVKLI